MARKKSEYKHRQVDSLLNAIGSPKDFWGEVRKYRHKKFTPNSISVEEWHDHFEQVLNDNVSPDGHCVQGLEDVSTFDELLDGDISETEIRQAIRNLKPGKAAGTDGIVCDF